MPRSPSPSRRARSGRSRRSARSLGASGRGEFEHPEPVKSEQEVLGGQSDTDARLGSLRRTHRCIEERRESPRAERLRLRPEGDLREAASVRDGPDPREIDERGEVGGPGRGERVGEESMAPDGGERTPRMTPQELRLLETVIDEECCPGRKVVRYLTDETFRRWGDLQNYVGFLRYR